MKESPDSKNFWLRVARQQAGERLFYHFLIGRTESPWLRVCISVGHLLLFGSVYQKKLKFWIGYFVDPMKLLFSSSLAI